MMQSRKGKTDYSLYSEKEMAEAILMVESDVCFQKKK